MKFPWPGMIPGRFSAHTSPSSGLLPITLLWQLQLLSPMDPIHVLSMPCCPSLWTNDYSNKSRKGMLLTHGARSCHQQHPVVQIFNSGKVCGLLAIDLSFHTQVPFVKHFFNWLTMLSGTLDSTKLMVHCARPTIGPICVAT